MSHLIEPMKIFQMYEAHREKNKKLLIYFLIHAGTVEEQSYLTAMRREKDAFEFLIETKSVSFIENTSKHI